MKNEIFKKVEKIVIKQHNRITEARYKMSSFEKNIFYMLLSKLGDDDPEGKVYEIYAKEIELLTNSHLHYTYLRRSVKKMLSCVYNLRINDEIVQLPLLTSSEYKKRTGIIELEISNKIRPFFFSLKNNYTLFQFQKAMKLKSKYSKRIYEMLYQFNSTGIFRISVKELKERFELINSETGKEQYKNFNDFNRNVLQVAQREINETTEIVFDYKIKENNQKVTDLEFKVRSKEAQKKLSKPAPVDLEAEKLKDRLVTKFELSKTLAKKIIENISLREIYKILYDIQIENGDNKIRKLGAYTTVVFQNRLDGVSPLVDKSNPFQDKPPSMLSENCASQNENLEKAQPIGYQSSLATARSGSPVSIGEITTQIQALTRPAQVKNNSLSEVEDLKKQQEENKIKEEKILVWKKLYHSFFRQDHPTVDLLVEKHSVEKLKLAISKVEEELKDQENPQGSSQKVQIFKKYLDLLT